MSGPRIRLHVEQPLGTGQAVALAPGQAHYLGSVMRQVPGDTVLLFNGADGEWRARLTHADRRGARLLCEEQTRPQGAPPDLWLLFAPLRRERTAFLVEKAVELGAARLLPFITRRTNAERLRLDRERAHAIEAAEQCGATWVPEVATPRPMAQILAEWPHGRQLFWADEARAGAGGDASTSADGCRRPDTGPEEGSPEEPEEGAAGREACGLGSGRPGPAAILIGPEGGFDAGERAALAGLPFVRPFGLGPRILRAETAALAALALWQARFGDWA